MSRIPLSICREAFSLKPGEVVEWRPLEMTNKELREAIESTICSLAPNGGPFVTPAKLPEEVKERIAKHLDQLLSIESERASMLGLAYPEDGNV